MFVDWFRHVTIVFLRCCQSKFARFVWDFARVSMNKTPVLIASRRLPPHLQPHRGSERGVAQV